MKFRIAVVLPAYFVLYTAAYVAAFLLRFDFDLSADRTALLWSGLPLVLAAKWSACLVTGEWRRSLRYATLRDMLCVVGSVTLAATLVALAGWVAGIGRPVPRSIILIDWFVTIFAICLLRSSFRLFVESFQPLLQRHFHERAVIFQSDRSGIGILRAVEATQAKYRVIGFVEETRDESYSLIAGLPVFRCTAQGSGWSKLVRRGVKHVLIPSTLPGKKMREIVQQCSAVDLTPHVIPGVDQLVDGRYKLAIRDVTISDLLRREPAQLDLTGIRGYVTGKRVLVTGGAGSIGSELCRQILALEPERLILVDQSESGVFFMEQEFAAGCGSDRVHYIVADVTDEHSISQVMREHRPQLVFHAAAYKHVPLMEHNPQEAIRNNIFGTKNLVDLAHRFSVERFVFVSTDKAVRPTSIMGSTKLVAEKYLQGMAARSSTRFITVRFGNVLNSVGSVIPTFRRQIEEGGPVTVTHPDMNRYFMTIPEAVQLVLQAGAIGGSGDVLILDMGEPVKIVDLAKDLICLSGLKYPDDIDIVFTGMRPGEKLYEELFYGSEAGARKVHDKIFCAAGGGVRLVQVNQDLGVLEESLSSTSAEAAQTLRDVVAHYVELDQQSQHRQAAA